MKNSRKYIPTKNTAVGIQTCHPIKCCFTALIILSCRHRKNNKCRERPFLNSPYLPKDRSSKRNSAVINPLSFWEFHQQGKSDTHRKGLESEAACTQTLSHTTCLPSSLLRAHSPFLKMMYSPLRSLPSLPFSY